jgi:hypothetical protein
MKARKAYFASTRLPATLTELDLAGVGDGELPALKEDDGADDITDEAEPTLLILVVAVGIADPAFVEVIAGEVSVEEPEVELSHTPVSILGQHGSFTTKVQLFGQITGHCG